MVGALLAGLGGIASAGLGGLGALASGAGSVASAVGAGAYGAGGALVKGVGTIGAGAVGAGSTIIKGLPALAKSMAPIAKVAGQAYGTYASIQARREGQRVVPQYYIPQATPTISPAINPAAELFGGGGYLPGEEAISKEDYYAQQGQAADLAKLMPIILVAAILLMVVKK